MKKVFKIMGSKLRIKDTKHQLSEIGFFETQRNNLIVRVDSNFKRVLKIKF